MTNDFRFPQSDSHSNLQSASLAPTALSLLVGHNDRELPLSTAGSPGDRFFHSHRNGGVSGLSGLCGHSDSDKSGTFGLNLDSAVAEFKANGSVSPNTNTGTVSPLNNGNGAASPAYTSGSGSGFANPALFSAPGSPGAQGKSRSSGQITLSNSNSASAIVYHSFESDSAVATTRPSSAFAAAPVPIPGAPAAPAVSPASAPARSSQLHPPLEEWSIKAWLPIVFAGFDEDLVQSFTSKLRDHGGFISVQDLLEACDRGELTREVLAEVAAFKIGHCIRLEKAIDALRL
jgi:hypothetical protein